VCSLDLIAPSFAADSHAYVPVFSSDSISWSPTLDALAFVAALDATTTDVYVLNPSTCDPVRLTSGELDAYNLHWSPDGRYIVQTAGYIGTGGGDFVDALWASASDGSANKYLYSGPQAEEERLRDRSGGEVIRGWLSPTTFLVNSWDASWGDRDLRSFDINTGAQNYAWPDRIDQIAFDPSSGAVLLSNSWAPHPPMFPEETGLFLVRPGRRPQFITANVGYGGTASWFSKPGIFIAETSEGYLSVLPNGDAELLAPPATDCSDPLPSPDGVYWAWKCQDNIVVRGPGPSTRDAFPGQSATVFWSPDSAYSFGFVDSLDGSLLRYDVQADTVFQTASGFSGTGMLPWPPAWIQQQDA
jgi:hypothetical protein